MTLHYRAIEWWKMCARVYINTQQKKKKKKEKESGIILEAIFPTQTVK